MFDFVLFPPAKQDGIELFEAGRLPKGIFASSSDLEKARALVKKVKYFHFQLYSPEQGFLKLMKEHECTLVVGLSDFFGVSVLESAKRLGRARVLAKIAQKEGVKIRVFSLAHNQYEVRSENEIYWICHELGICDAQFESMKREKIFWERG